MIRAGRVAAVGLLAALVGGALAVGKAPSPDHERVPSSTAASRASTEVTPTTTIGSTTATTALSSSSTALPVSGRSDVLSAVEGAMAAWGRFALSGDLDQVEPFFVVDGPQYRLFVEEAVALAAAPSGLPPYRVLVEISEVVRDAGEAWATARVRFVRTGEPSQSFGWVIVLRRVGYDWKVWTVEDEDATGGE